MMSSMAGMIPPQTAPVGSTGPTPFIEIDYMDTGDNLKKFICDAYQRMFTDKWHSLVDVALTTVEGAMRSNEQIKRMNQTTINLVIDQIFDSPLTQEEFVRHLSGGCAIPRQAREFIFRPGSMSSSDEKRARNKVENPSEVFTKYLAPSSSNSKVYRGGRGRRMTQKKR